MNRDEIDALWQQAMHDAIAEGEQMTRYHFADLVAAAEREACAQLCEAEAEKWEGDDGPISTEARLCALHIRARGTND